MGDTLRLTIDCAGVMMWPRHEHGIDRRVGMRAVPAFAVDHDLDAIRRRPSPGPA
jgi:hypothetical protein